MITKTHIDEYIRLTNNGHGIGGHSQRPKIFADRSDYSKKDNLFSRLILEKNSKVSVEISNKTKEMISTTFDSNETYEHFKKYVYWYRPDEKYIAEKPWWKFWVKLTIT